MKYITLLIGMFLSCVVSSDERKLEHISQLVWENRVILIYPGDEVNLKKINYEALFKKFNDEIKERDILWFIIKGKEVLTNYPNTLSNDFIVNTKSKFQIEKYKILLIGKDGGVKAKGKDLNLDMLFEEVDGMPMRQQEIKSK